MQLFAALGLWFAMLYPIHYVEPELQPYVDSYNRITSEYCGWEDYVEPRQTIVTFSDLTRPAIGVCIKYGFGWVVEIDRNFWATASEEDKFHLMTHEQSHCRLGLSHAENEPGHYMYPSIEQIPTETVIYQLLSDAKIKCSKE